MQLTLGRDDRRHRARHGAGADAPVGQEVAGDAGGGLRQRAALDPAGDGDPVVLPADPAAASAGRSGAELSAIITFTVFEAAYYSRDHARRHPVGAASGQVYAGYAVGMTYAPEHEADRAAAGLPQHAAGAADADHHPVPGHLAGLRHRRLRPAQGLRGRRQELQPPGRDLPDRRRRLLRHLLQPVDAGPAAAEEDRHHPLKQQRDPANDRHQERLQVVRHASRC